MKEFKDREYENALVWKIGQQIMDIDILENENTRLQTEVNTLSRKNRELEAEIAELRAQLGYLTDSEGEADED